ncbi:MAG TPA: TetR/AcrR family transcriptional regulator [Amycolatopsis sp.]|uniref:TetR/AcrR family transcriptional regulator n=1 Tax=Amycolatopsis sp. TaxID=37632 RepID=UPI002B472A4F|nr:TetR/AcrR family transcriptional regulator [Amycolatopsis sp.]HKS44189.1 TetR/AcrR family transcriptional regulator [Amycolatopsis sp.]
MVEWGTAERIAAAALAILLREGAQAVTMRRVAADAGVTTMASYRHYPNRDGLLRAVVDAAFADLGNAWGKRVREVDFEARFYGLLDDFLDFALGKPNLYRFLITDRREGVRRFPEDFRAGRSPAFTPVIDVVEQGMRDGVLRADDPLEAALAITMPVMGLVQLYLGGRMGMSERDFRALCRRTVGRVLDGTAST